MTDNKLILLKQIDAALTRANWWMKYSTTKANKSRTVFCDGKQFTEDELINDAMECANRHISYAQELHDNLYKEEKMKKKLKLYVWKDVFRDYTAGMACALACSTEQARELVLKKIGYSCDSILADLAIEPECVESPEGFYVYGGG